jgi:hypothetical protein
MARPAPQSPSSVIWGLYNRPEVAVVSTGLSPTPLITIIIIITTTIIIIIIIIIILFNLEDKGDMFLRNIR